MTLASAIYTGHVRHRRPAPKHGFTFPLCMVYLDLHELERVLGMSRLWGRGRWRVARFCRADYFGGEGDLADAVRSEVERQIGRRPSGPVRMLTHLRYFGYIFNPVTFYYCFNDDGSLDAIMSQITNTPWGERHTYVMDAAASRRGGEHAHFRSRFDKDFHVSPFLPMDIEYDWSFTEPGEELFVHMNLRDREAGGKSFDATLKMLRREMSPSAMRWMLVRYPAMTLQVIAKIHWEALRLWLKRASVHPHPGKAHPVGPDERSQLQVRNHAGAEGGRR